MTSNSYGPRARAVANEASSAAGPYISARLSQPPSLTTELQTYLEAGAPHGELAIRYLTALLDGQRHVASQMILEAVAGGVGVGEIYEHVFQLAQYEVGRLWVLNEVSIAQEHYCTAATQLIMSQLYPYVFASEKRGLTLVATCVAGDYHEVGVRMVTDLFEMDGWSTFYLGANTPPGVVLDTVAQQNADVLAVSVTLSAHVEAVAVLIDGARGRADCKDVKILVGGGPFRVAPDLWKSLGADGCAGSAREGIALAERWMVERGAT
jgi:MerR family transcriptional regulator, light-induced transcriptional regulator